MTAPVYDIPRLPTYDDVKYILTVAVIIFFLRFIVSGTQSKFSKNIPNVLGLISKNIIKPGSSLKFAENGWYGLWHTTSFTMTSYYLFNETEWFRQSVLSLNADFAFATSDIFPTVQVDTIYMIQTAFWVSCVMYCFLETWRSDFWVMMAHHAFTLGLLGVSWRGNLWRIGMIVFWLHDISDIFLYWAKCLSYTKAPAWMSDNFFVLFATSFFSTRNVLFPYFCIWGCVRCVFFGVGPESAWFYALVSLVLASLLECLHIYWFTLILNMAKKQLFVPKETKKAMNDVRSFHDSDEERSDAEEPKAAKKPAHPAAEEATTGSEADIEVRQRK